MKIGEMNIDEFKEAIKEILKPEEKQKESFSEAVSKFFSDLKKDISDFGKIIGDIITFKHVRAFFAEPLTKEVFIRRGKKTKAFLNETVSTIVFVVVAIIFIKYFFFEIRWIPSASMHPTLIEGDRVFVNTAQKYKTPQRGDIMIFYPPSVLLENTPVKVFSRLTGFFCQDIAYIKRVIGLPGDTIEVKPDKRGIYAVYINGDMLDENYIKNPLDYTECTERMYCGPLTLGKDEYFMMGDNRGNSQDSRYWGPLKQDRFIGKASFVFRLNKLK